MQRTAALLIVATTLALCACSGNPPRAERPVGLVVLDPGHFHASLLQKERLAGISDTVWVYAPEGPEVGQYLTAVEGYNSRPEQPTAWCEAVYTGEDYLARMLADKHGEAVVLAGNNRRKTDYILESVRAGYNVLSDKPLAINKADFAKLSEAYALADRNGRLIYDLMTERYDLLNIVVREVLQDSTLFGRLLPGTPDAPAVTMRSVHHFFKEVSGNPLRRPAWYYDVEQQGEGIADVTTHLIDLVFWQCFPGQPVRYAAEVEVLAARHWPTIVSLADYTRSTGAETFPPYLEKDVRNGALSVMSNGSLVYKVKGVHVGMEVVWNFEAPEGGGDTFAAVMQGSRASLEIEQNERTGFVKQLYIVPAPGTDAAEFERHLSALTDHLKSLSESLSVAKQADGRWLIDVPVRDRLGHEEHFSRVAEAFLGYLRKGGVPEWERENTLSKYYITTTAVELAKQTE